MASPEDPVACEGLLTYQSASLQSTLYRNGQLTLPRNPDGTSGPFKGLDNRPLPIRVRDARQSSPRPTLDTHGFTLTTDAPPPSNVDFLHAASVTGAYYAHCEAEVCRATGASHAFAFDHNIRTSGPAAERDAETGSTQRLQAPVALVHADYTLTSAPERLQQLTAEPKKNDTRRAAAAEGPLIPPELLKRASRYGIVNVWRSIRGGGEKIKRNPLVCCAADSVREEEDLVVLEIHYDDRVGENYFVKHSERHRWFVYPDMTGDEAVLLKTWDSAGAFARRFNGGGDGGRLATFAVHSGLGDYVGMSAEEMAQLPDRWSIEVRVAFLFVEE